jgi:hypothetical protein
MRNRTVPLPFPLALPVMVIQGARLAATQGQSLALVTSTTSSPPEAATDCSKRPIVSLQGVPVPAWFTANVRSAIVSVPLRVEPVLGSVR